MEMLLTRFVDGLSIGVSKKGMDSFWPVGLRSTSMAFGPKIVYDLEDAIVRHAGGWERPVFDHPTSALVVSAYLLFAGYFAQTPTNTVLSVIDKLLHLAQAEKAGDLFNADGRNLILTEDAAKRAFEKTSFATSSEDRDAINHLSGAVLALAEAMFFINHRVATEKHGPYSTGNQNRYSFLRSVNDFRDGLSIWPELNSAGFPFETGLLRMETEVFDVRFDMYSNIVHSVDINELTLSAEFEYRYAGSKHALAGGQSDSVLKIV